MKFEQLIVHNFGAYKGQHVIDLGKASRARPIILVGGLNGAGKSTLMDAIQLALFGKLAKCGARKGLGYEEFLRRSVHHDVLPRQASVQLRLHYQAAGQTHTYTVHRGWTCGDRAVKEHVEVFHNGVLDKALSDSWLEHVAHLLPPELSQLFFFDGEQLEALADPATSAEVLRTAVESLLGLDLVKRLNADLDLVEHRNRRVGLPPEEQRELEKLEQEIAASEVRRAELVTDEAVTRSAVERTERQLADVNARFAREGGELFERRGVIEGQKLIVEEGLERVGRELRDLAGGAAPLLLVRPMLVALEVQADREGVARVARSVQAILEERDQAVLQSLRSLRLSTSSLNTVAQVLAADRGSRAADPEQPYANISDTTRQALSSLNRETLDQARARMLSLTEEWASLRAADEEYQRQLAAIPTAAQLADLLEERDRARSALASAKANLESAMADLARVRSHLSKLGDQKRRRSLALHETKGKFADAQRSLRHIGKVRTTLLRFREALLQRHVERLETLALDSLQQLLRKERLVTGLRIDSTSFAVTLRGGGGVEVSTERLSAGERQLLATALLWGLRRAAGRAVPLVIDTPLGRLDSSHREHLVARYFPHASHQVVLLSTDEEIAGRYYNMLKPHVASAFTLETDDRAQTVRVREGYFESHQGATVAP